MDYKKMKKFIEFAKSEGVSELKYKGEGEEIFVSFVQSTSAPIMASPNPTVAAPQATGSANLQSPNESGGGHLVKSPLVGTFYASPSPSDPVYAKVGDKVTKGQVLCIVEAMKIMNEIEADASGVIQEILVDNEDLVEFGQPLFRIS